MRFLVTGGAGFIGSNIVERLLKEGHFVRVLDNFCGGKEKNLSFTDSLPATNFELIRGDIRDKSTCDTACNGIDYVLHQAALRSVPGSLKDPESYNDVNINGTLYMLQAASKNKVKRFVLATSAAVYGNTDKFPQREEDYPLLISPYALSKLAGEYYCRIYSEVFGLETVSLRYFNVFGPRQAADDEYSLVIPKFISCILRDEQPPIFGTGEQSRDFVYVDNIVEANILAATTSGIKCGLYNVGDGKDTTILHLVASLNKIIGKNIKPAFLPVRAGDAFKNLSDITKIKKELGYRTNVDFESGLGKTVDYFRLLGRT